MSPINPTLISAWITPNAPMNTNQSHMFIMSPYCVLWPYLQLQSQKSLAMYANMKTENTVYGYVFLRAIN